MAELTIMGTKISLRLKHFIIALAAFAICYALFFIFLVFLYVAAYIAHADIFFITDEMGYVVLNSSGTPSLNTETVAGIFYIFGVFLELDRLVLPIFPLILARLGRWFAKEEGSELSLFSAAFIIFAIYTISVNLLPAVSPALAEYTGAPTIDLSLIAWILGAIVIFGLIYPWMIIFTRPEKEKLIESVTYSLIFAFAMTIIVYLIGSIANISLFQIVYGQAGYTMAYVFVLYFVLAFAAIYYFRGRKMGAIAAVLALMYIFNGIISSKSLVSTVLTMPDLTASLILRIVGIALLFLLCKINIPEKKAETPPAGKRIRRTSSA